VATVVRALQLDHDEPASLVDSEQVDASPGVLPLAELLSDDK
jgi:hypothetical protein